MKKSIVVWIIVLISVVISLFFLLKPSSSDNSVIIPPLERAILPDEGGIPPIDPAEKDLEDSDAVFEEIDEALNLLE
jgi:hypothetical protein